MAEEKREPLVSVKGQVNKNQRWVFALHAAVFVWSFLAATISLNSGRSVYPLSLDLAFPLLAWIVIVWLSAVEDWNRTGMNRIRIGHLFIDMVLRGLAIFVIFLFGSVVAFFSGVMV